MTKTIEPGTLVITESGREYVYGGPADMPGYTRIKFDFRSDGPSEIQCDMDAVAPTEVAERVNLKDPRISVARQETKPAYASGKWLHEVTLPDGTVHQGWHKTKRDGTAEAAHRLAIADWHADSEA
jgi:hypothetical protein